MASSPRDLPEERLPSTSDVCKGKDDTGTSMTKNLNTDFFLTKSFSNHHFREEKERKIINWKTSQNTTAKGEIFPAQSDSVNMYLIAKIKVSLKSKVDRQINVIIRWWLSYYRTTYIISRFGTGTGYLINVKIHETL